MRPYLFIAIAYGFLAVAFGAFGAHALREHLSPYAMGIYHTAFEYQLFHALALALVAFARPATPCLRRAAKCFAVGVFIFSGSLYGLALTDLKWLGAITPLGGILFLTGWGNFGLWCYRHFKS